jgi:hypothetical protein
MGKYERLGTVTGRPLDNLFPAGFDGQSIAEFFSGKRGVSEDILDAIEAALDSDDEDIGNLDFGGYLTTTEDHMLGHTHDGEHDHAHDDEDTGVDLFAGAANGKPTHAKGNGSDSTDGGTATKGGGKGKTKTTDPVAEEPVVDQTDNTDPVAEEPVAEEPVAEVPIAEEPIVQEPAPAPSPANFGWLDSNTYLSGGDTPDGFNLLLNFDGTWTQTQKNVGAAMAEEISDFIIGDLADYNGVDDVSIRLWTADIDGANGIWGQGGWYSLRGDGTVVTGGVRLDSNDLGTAESYNLLDELFMHEMLHAIGFGTTWSRDGLVSGSSYIGENGMDVYGGPVPYDGKGHLSESVGNEMGTTFITNNAEPITDLTLAILEDMGYQTIYDATAYA